MVSPLDAIAGVANAAQPLPNLITGGQPTPETLAKLKAAGRAAAATWMGAVARP